MATTSDKATPQDGKNPNRPANEGQPKGPASADSDAQERYEEFEGEDPNTAASPEMRHPNRNTDKPEVDKPAYGGGH